MPHVDTPQTWCLGSVARRDITPPVGIYHRMWGAATHDRSIGVHRPLTVTALLLAASTDDAAKLNGPARQVLVAVDHCLLWNDPMEQLVARVCQTTGLPRDQLHLAFSHTHAAGLMDPRRTDLPGGDLIAGYLETVAVQISDAVRECLSQVAPLRIVYGTGRSTLAAHRDFWDADNELFVCGLNPDGPTDDTVLVARITDAQSRTVCTVVNYACHPTTLAWDNQLISPDYVGALRETVETATSAPCLFLQGASGDLGPRHGYVGDVSVADRNGRELGYAALAALEALPAPGTRFEYTGPVVSGATIGTWDYRSLPPEELCEKHRWQCERFEVALPYRADLPGRAATETQLAHWRSEEQAARAQGEEVLARDCRAQAERMMRQLARLESLPPGDSVPVAVSLWRLGDAVWLSLQGEHYNLLQRALRERFAGRPLMIATVTDGWQPGYVPTRETYGQGIYQESIAVVAPGSLEQLIDAIGERIAELTPESWHLRVALTSVDRTHRH